MGWGGSLQSGGGGGGPGPEVQNFVPADGTDISRNTPLTFDVIFGSPLVALTITVVYRNTGATEVAYNIEGFTPNYSFASERSSITGGYHFILKRRSGWPMSPSVLVEGADENGGRVAGAL